MASRQWQVENYCTSLISFIFNIFASLLSIMLQIFVVFSLFLIYLSVLYTKVLYDTTDFFFNKKSLE